jgi:putative ABC transport system permease protein
LVLLAPKDLTQFIEIDIDVRIYLFAAGLAVLTSILFGLAPALAGSRPALTGLLQSLLFNVSPRDPLTFAAIPVIIAIIALLSAYLPARRASRLDPMASRRAE